MLNFVRWKLETLVQYAILVAITRDGNVDPAKRDVLKRLFSLDVRAEKLEKERQSPQLLPYEDYELPQLIAPRSDKYADGRSQNRLESLPDRPSTLDALAARYGGGQRQVRYARGRRFTIMDPEGDFLEVPKVSSDVSGPGLFESLRQQRMGADSSDPADGDLQALAGIGSGAEVALRNGGQDAG